MIENSISTIDQLRADPVEFFKLGRANDLLKEFFRGRPLSDLKTILEDKYPYVLRTAIWVASELGKKAILFIEQAIALSDHDDYYIRFISLDIIMLASKEENYKNFKYITDHLNDHDERVRWKAMKLSLAADFNQLQAALDFYEHEYAPSEHLTGIKLLLQSDTISQNSLQLGRADSLILRSYSILELLRSSERCSNQVELVSLQNDKNLNDLVNRSSPH